MRNREIRGWQLLGIFFLLFMVLGGSLFHLSIVRGGEMSVQGADEKTRTVKLTGQRGSITDAHGIPLAYDKASYDVEINRDPSKGGERWRALYTEAIMTAINIVEKHGGKSENLFVIKRDASGRMFFDYGSSLDANVVSARDKLWRQNMYIDAKATPREAYNALRVRYMLPEELGFEAATKVLSVWQEIQNYAYLSYVPVTIAQGVSMAAVSEIEDMGEALLDIHAVESTVREYPKNETAAHIIGYMGREYSEERLAALKEQGYQANDLVGILGVENTMEEYLSANSSTRAGYQVVEVSSSSRVVRELERKEPANGNTVQLTIDYDLQKKTEEALQKNIEAIYAEQQRLYQENYGGRDGYAAQEARLGRKTRFAKTGAAVVMDVNTGNILAMASYPSYNLNLFTGGISQEDYALLQDEETTPMFNKAISSRAEPGSIFKMVTGYAGLMEGVISPNTLISCLREYTKNIARGEGPKCGHSNATHHNQDVIKALKNSCNYFFFEVANRMDVDQSGNSPDNPVLNKWATQFGLNSKTNVQMTGEVSSYVASQKALFDNTMAIDGGQRTYKAYLVRNVVIGQLKGFCVLRGKEHSEETIKKAADSIVALVSPGVTRTELLQGIRETMRKELDIPESITLNRTWDQQIWNTLFEIIWNSTQTIWTGIGQSVTAVTPIGAARYVAAIANGGRVYDASIIDKVVDGEGNVVYDYEPKVVGTLDDSQGYLALLQEGMREVVSLEERGTAAEALKGFKYKDDMAGKTGSAQVSDIDLENTSWFVAYTPLEKEGVSAPEIAVVVYIPHGISGARSAVAAKDIIQYYRERNEQQENPTVVGPGNLLD